MKYMEEYFGAYTDEDITQGQQTMAKASVGKGAGFSIIDQTGATFVDDQGREYIDCTSQAWSLNIGAGRP